MNSWVEERLHQDFRTRLKATKILHDSQSDYHRITIFENSIFGRTLALDEIIQTTEVDEYTYHEMLVHVPVFAHGAVHSVLIVGGGDGGALEELFKHRHIETVTMVEIDGQVVELSKKWLGGICGQAFSDPRLKLIIGNGADFVVKDEEFYDLVIIDSTDPIGPGEALFSSEFYRNCRRRMAPGGVLVAQSGVPFLQSDGLRESYSCLRESFVSVSCYITHVPTYVGGLMCLVWASDDETLMSVSVSTLSARYRAASINTRQYGPEVHKAAFVLPPYIQELMV